MTQPSPACCTILVNLNSLSPFFQKKKKKKQNKIKEEKNTLVSYFHGDDGPRLTSIVAPSEPQTRGCEEGILRQLNPPPGTPEHSG